MSLFGFLKGGKGSGKAGGADAPPLTEPLPNAPEALTRAYQADHTAWNNWAHAQYERTKKLAAAEAAYSRLVAHYCGPEKQHQLITFSSDPGFDVERSEITARRDEDPGCIVCMKHTNDNGFVAEYEFEFARDGDRWRLVEVYYLDDYDDQRMKSL